MKPKKSTSLASAGKSSLARHSALSSTGMVGVPCGMTTIFSGASPRETRSLFMRWLCTVTSEACSPTARPKSPCGAVGCVARAPLGRIHRVYIHHGLDAEPSQGGQQAWQTVVISKEIAGVLDNQQLHLPVASGIDNA